MYTTFAYSEKILLVSVFHAVCIPSGTTGADRGSATSSTATSSGGCHREANPCTSADVPPSSILNWLWFYSLQRYLEPIPGRIISYGYICNFLKAKLLRHTDERWRWCCSGVRLVPFSYGIQCSSSLRWSLFLDALYGVIAPRVDEEMHVPLSVTSLFEFVGLFSHKAKNGTNCVHLWCPIPPLARAIICVAWLCFFVVYSKIWSVKILLIVMILCVY